MAIKNKIRFRDENGILLPGWRWAYFLFCVLGVLLIILQLAISKSFPALANTAGGLGVAFIVGGIIGLIHTFSLEPELQRETRHLERELQRETRHRKMESLGVLMWENGLRSIYTVRPLNEIEAAIKNAKEHIKIAGSSLKGLVGTKDVASNTQKSILNSFLDRINEDVNLRLLLAHPSVSWYRENMEGRDPGQIPVEIIENLLRIMSKLREASNGEDKKWEIGLYMCGPSVFSVEVDDRVLFLEPYPLAGTSMSNFCIRCETPVDGENDIKKFMRAHFDSAWERPEPTITKVKSIDIVEKVVKELFDARHILKEQYDRLMNAIKKY